MTHALAALLLGCAAASTRQQADERELAPRAALVSGVAAVVNDDVVTVARVARVVDELRRGAEISSREELVNLQKSALRRAVNERLRVQAGQDLGLAAEDVGRRVEQLLERRREERGLRGQADYFRSLGLDSAGARENTESMLYHATWYFGVTGRGPGARGRPYRDRHVRPGELRAAHELAAAARDGDLVSFQILEIRAAAVGGSENAHALARDCLGRARSGESFDALVDEYGAYSRPTHGRAPSTSVGRVAPALRSFATEAEVGEITDVLPAPGSDPPAAYWIVRLNERVPAPPPPPFDDAATQADFTDRIVGAREGRWIEEAEQALERRAWLWPSSKNSSAKAPASP